MKVIVRKSEQFESGYEMSIVNDDGTASVQELKFWSAGKTNPRYKTTLLLPKNPANRTYFEAKQLEKAGPEGVELEYRETRVLGPYKVGVPKKPWEEYMTEEEKAQYDTIREACFARKAEAEKPKELTEAEKLQLEIEKLTAKLAALQSKKAE